jgi:hypothetical protein
MWTTAIPPARLIDVFTCLDRCAVVCAEGDLPAGYRFAVGDRVAFGATAVGPTVVAEVLRATRLNKVISMPVHVGLFLDRSVGEHVTGGWFLFPSPMISEDCDGRPQLGIPDGEGTECGPAVHGGRRP